MGDRIRGMEIAFSDAMAQGWAAGAAKSSMPLLPNFKIVTPPSPEGCRWTLVDQYYAHPEGGYFFGHTLMYQANDDHGGNIIVWRMSYEGNYVPAALSCLKAALRVAHETRRWYGGRGPYEFAHNGSVYTNHPDPPDFTNFRGREFIIDCDTHQPLGYAEYHGRLIA